MADSSTLDQIKGSQQTGTMVNGAKPLPDSQYANLKSVYDQLCTSYRAIDDFRARLLGLLPLASAGSIFLLFNQFSGEDKSYLTPIGAFGFLVTLGLFAYEIYGIKKCDALIQAGQRIEGWLHVDGQFIGRPREVLDFINEPFAAGVIYPAVLAAWTYLGLAFRLPKAGPWLALLVFLVGLGVSLFYNARLKKGSDERRTLTGLNQCILEAEETGNGARLAPLLANDFAMVRASGEKQDRQAFLDAVSDNRCRGRTADHVELRLYGDCAVYSCRVTTARDKEGNPDRGQFWNTRLFVCQDGEWRCTAWQVMKICNA